MSSEIRNPDRVKFLQIEPTTRCNFICDFCCGRRMDQSDITWENFTKTIDSFPDVTHLELQGEGEPLLHPKFFEMATYARNKGIKVSTITNGSLFLKKRVPKILESGISAILVSIESQDPKTFQAIRGGKFDSVRDGIRELLSFRNEAGRDTPVVGFAVTVLRSTQDQAEGIVRLYQELGMDGGILVHTLSHMNAYAQFYSAHTRDELMSEMSQALVWARYERILKSNSYMQSAHTHFWDDIFGRKKGSSSQTNKLSTFSSCPWLDKSLFVNRHGVVSACPNVKDADRFGFGEMSAGAREILDNRERMRTELQSRRVPEACQGCFIATSVHQQPGACIDLTSRNLETGAERTIADVGRVDPP